MKQLLDRFLNRTPSAATGAETSAAPDETKKRTVAALEQATMHDRLGPAKHLLALAMTDAGLREYLTANKDAADTLTYCYYRFSSREIPAELQYVAHEMSKVLKGYAVELDGRENVNGIRKLIRSHLAGFRGTEETISLFKSENTATLLDKMRSTLEQIEAREEDYISREKSNHLLQELGMFLQNHYSVDSYLSYDSKPNGKPWSDAVKFALSYLSSEVPLDRIRLDQLTGHLRKTTIREDGEDVLKSGEYSTERENEIQIQLFVADVQQETLNYGLEMLTKKMSGVVETVQATLIERFKTRHAEYWSPLKERVQKLTANSVEISL